MTYENFIKGQLVGIALQQGARYGGFDVMLAIGQVHKNRVNAGWGDWLQIIAGSRGMSGTFYETANPVDPRSIEFRTMLARVDDIYHGTAEDVMTEGALYYGELHNITSEWFKENILAHPGTHPRVAKVGDVTFFA